VVKDKSVRNTGDVSPRHNMKGGYYKQNTVKIRKEKQCRNMTSEWRVIETAVSLRVVSI